MINVKETNPTTEREQFIRSMIRLLGFLHR